MSEETVPLLARLKQHFGFESFRPLQEEIIRDVLNARDVFALLPTGGGKSLCFQLPAIIQGGLTVVVSPLIALMKDQVDALQASGIPATFLNSSLTPQEASARLRGLHDGEYRLLYLAPERLMVQGFAAEIARWNLRLVAIDEAHCISEWGHDFRPEYRQLAEVRQAWAGVPVLAVTATATQRVRSDITQQLQLRNPQCYVASFNRPNLTYRVIPRTSGYEQVLEYVRNRPNESGIIYCHSRKGTESLSERLKEDGIEAQPYHAGLDRAVRTKHQDLFLRDETRVMCATIAFGMGINKPNVRYVIHYDLPKNLESYYQETGRAGRDGLPSDCLLLFSAADVVKQLAFIREKPTALEQQNAKHQLNEMVGYAESSGCRRARLLAYFGERWPDGSCEGCDNCNTPRQMFDGTVAAQKFLSCVFRIRERSGFSVGLAHIVEVLTGASTEKVRKWGHQELSTYGIGKEFNKRDWSFLGRELIRLGFVSQLSEKFNVVELTVAGMSALRERRTIQLGQPPVIVSETRAQAAGTILCDESLFHRLRQLRKQLADERGVPPYIVFSDVALRQMAHYYPRTSQEFSRISGVGERKLAEYGVTFLAEIADFLGSNPRQNFATQPSTAPSGRKKISETVADSLRRFRRGQSPTEIATARQLVAGTIYGHLAMAAENGESFDLALLVTSEELTALRDAFKRFGYSNVVGVRDTLGDKFDYGLLRLCAAVLQREGR